MARRRHNLNPEAFSVEQRRKGGEDFNFATVAAAAVDAVDVGRTFNFLQQRGLHAGDGFIHRHRHGNAVFIARAK